MTVTAAIPYAVDDCRSCHRPIIWAVNEKTLKVMPLDADPAPTGNIAIAGANKALRCRVIPPHLAYGRTDLRLSHFATCPHADKWRRRKTP
jgi:hypothetical protein